MAWAWALRQPPQALPARWKKTYRRERAGGAVSDRTVLDTQLQEAIFDFARHRRGHYLQRFKRFGRDQHRNV